MYIYTKEITSDTSTSAGMKLDSFNLSKSDQRKLIDILDHLQSIERILERMTSEGYDMTDGDQVITEIVNIKQKYDAMLGF